MGWKANPSADLVVRMVFGRHEFRRVSAKCLTSDHADENGSVCGRGSEMEPAKRRRGIIRGPGKSLERCTKTGRRLSISDCRNNAKVQAEFSFGISVAACSHRHRPS